MGHMILMVGNNLHIPHLTSSLIRIPFNASGRCSTPVGPNPRIEGASMMVYLGKPKLYHIKHDIAF